VLTFSDTDGEEKIRMGSEFIYYIVRWKGIQESYTNLCPAGGDFHIISWLEGSSPKEIIFYLVEVRCLSPQKTNDTSASASKRVITLFSIT
jgi:hypothetical protein